MNKWYKDNFNHNIHPHSFNEGDLILAYDVVEETLGLGKF